MQKFSESLIAWYKKNKRDLPWRHTKDPYKIWLSEIIMQQTQVAQGLPYYNKFVQNYPTVKLLAEAPIDEVLRLWQGLGYYSRARNLHAAAKSIVQDHEGVFPHSYDAIRSLKGVGDYTAAAIASMAYGMPYAVVDGNVYRVLSRVFNINKPIDTSEGKKYFQKLANEMLVPKRASDYNQAIMEFGALHCKPANPDCQNCVLSDICLAYSKKLVNQLPVKSKKTKVQNRYFNYCVFQFRKSLYIKKRGEKDIWQGLYEFYLIEKKRSEKPEVVLENAELKKNNALSRSVIKLVSKEYKHLLSHQHLYTRFYLIELKSAIKLEGMKKVAIAHLDKYPFPRLLDKFIKEHVLV